MGTMAKVQTMEACGGEGGAGVVRPVLAVGLGRGSAGKSTALAEIVQRGRAAGRDVIVADGDLRSKTLKGLFPDALVPPSEELPDVKDWISGLLDRMVEENRSLVLDLGGGDRVLLEYGRDLELVEFCEFQGIDPLAVYVLGPDPEDLEHCLSIARQGYFRPSRTLLVFNEGVVRAGKTTIGAFDDTLAAEGLRKMEESGAKAIVMPKLPCMDKVRKARLDFYGAVGGRAGPDLTPTERFMVRKWLRDLEELRRGAGVDGWLP